MKKLFLMFMLLTPFAMAYGERNEIIVSPIYGKQKTIMTKMLLSKVLQEAELKSRLKEKVELMMMLEWG